MKKIIFYFLFLIPVLAFSQAYQTSAPWMQDSDLKKKGKITLEDISLAAEKYFSTIDRFKKGSGYKPFMRWEYQNSFLTNADGTLKTNTQLEQAWQQKQEMNASAQNNANDTSNWSTLGPFTHTNTASWSSGQGRVNVVVVDPNNENIYYVGTPAGGIWKSIDAGINWTPLNDFQRSIGVSGIAIDPTNSDIIYIATGDDDAGDSSSIGVLKSTDGGTTWSSTGNMAGSSMNDIYIDPTAPNTVIVATNIGVQKSTDGGNSWTRTLSGNIKDLKRKPGSSTVFYAASTSTVYVSSDGGDSFSAVSITGFSGSRRIALAVTPANANVVYFVSYNQTSSKNGFNGVYKSLDSGFSFTKTNENDDIFEGSQSWYDLDITVSDTDEDIVFVGVLNIWKSTDGGNDFSKINSWNAPNAASYTHADIHFLNYSGGKFFAGTDGGVYVSTNNGGSFTDLTENLVIGQFYKISVANQNAGNIVGGLQDNGGYAFKNNGWSNYYGADGMDCAVNPLDPEHYYGFIQYGGSLYQSKDGGLTRTSSVLAPSAETGAEDSGGRWVTPLAADRKGNLYAGYSSLYKLVSGTWAKVSNHDFGGDLYHIEIDPNNEKTIYVSRGSSVYQSIDAGTTFTKLSQLNFGTINAMEISHHDSNVGWFVMNGGVYKSSNLRSTNPTFTNINGNLPFSDNKIVLRHHSGHKDNRVYLGTTLGVYYIDDTLAQWQTFDNNLPNSPIRDLEINEKEAKLIVATYGRGVWVTNIPNAFPENEIKLVSIDSPLNNATGCGLIEPTITIQNKGINAITNVTVNYTIDGGTPSVYNWTGNLTSSETTQISIPSFAATVGNHSMDIETVINNDTFATNNSSNTEFSINDSTATPTTVNTFETTNDNLSVETIGSGGGPFGLWQRGNPQKSLLNTVGSGNAAYVTNLFGNHPDNTTGYLYTKCYDMTLITNPILSFKMAFDIEENWDHMYVEYTIDQGRNWLILGTKNDPNWYNSSAKTDSSQRSILPGKQWTGEGENSNPLGGTNATLHDYSFDLASFTNESNVIFRFTFVADEASNEEGALIDDLVITGTLPVEEFNEINGLTVSPNPSNNLFNINWSQGTDFAISVFDMTGKLVLQEKNSSLTRNQFSLDMSKYSKGIYFAKIKVGESQSTKKLILK
ncbi:MAG: T9SS type A sorting domain-containing protein [Polaribacter sp.]|nr:T9SS type A sorting domain-containing protein [Polaribacter sp.]MDG1811883.1 T9SS type A sorting domain-containing protein [Polaribacter sp.]MDG1993714.1 T9SS type A sorting domain-containing protein [Polaribacter sp.]